MYKIQPITVAFQKMGNLKFCPPYKITIQNREGLSNFEKLVFDFSVQYPKKSGLSKKLKVSTLDIPIKQSGLQVSHSKVPNSDKSICSITTSKTHCFRRLPRAWKFSKINIKF